MKIEAHRGDCPATGDCDDCDHDHTCNCDGPVLLANLLAAARNTVAALKSVNSRDSELEAALKQFEEKP